MRDLEDAIDKCSRMIDELPSLTEYRAALSKIADLEARLAKYQEALEPLARISLWRDAYPDATHDGLTDNRLPFTATEVRRARALTNEGEKS